jgi:hypothetical protein
MGISIILIWHNKVLYGALAKNTVNILCGEVCFDGKGDW